MINKENIGKFDTLPSTLPDTNRRCHRCNSVEAGKFCIEPHLFLVLVSSNEKVLVNFHLTDMVLIIDERQLPPRGTL
jgi:hypothetical protein